MALKIRTLQRDFFLDGRRIVDPNPALSIDEVRAHYAGTYPALNNASYEEENNRLRGQGHLQDLDWDQRLDRCRRLIRPNARSCCSNSERPAAGALTRPAAPGELSRMPGRHKGLTTARQQSASLYPFATAPAPPAIDLLPWLG